MGSYGARCSAIGQNGEEAGSSESAEFAAVNPEVHGRTSTYDLGIDIGLAGTSNNENLTDMKFLKKNILN